jgi:hypothetical protein
MESSARGALSLLMLLQTSCAGAVGSSRIEDKARRDIPIAICRKPLSASDLDPKGAPLPEAYWGVLLPGFRGFDVVMDSAVDCVGDALATREAAARDGGAAREGALAASSMHASPADFTVSPAVDGMETAWLRTSTPSERLASGPLALVRPRPAELDVYAIGFYRGSSRNSRFEFTRLGKVSAVTAQDDGCADVKVETECESTTTFYLMVGGQLVSAAKTPSRRVQYGTLKAVGRVQFRLTTEPPIFDDHSVHIREKLSVRDSSDDEVRKSEGERIFTLTGVELVPNGESISSQAIGHP